MPAPKNIAKSVNPMTHVFLFIELLLFFKTRNNLQVNILAQKIIKSLYEICCT
ncbi:hypothetical protein JMUB7481_16840 [Staphylococcus aureus]|nr:hypothetical protein RVB3_06820 [Staphylococcus aureus]